MCPPNTIFLWGPYVPYTMWARFSLSHIFEKNSLELILHTRKSRIKHKKAFVSFIFFELLKRHYTIFEHPCKNFRGAEKKENFWAKFFVFFIQKYFLFFFVPSCRASRLVHRVGGRVRRSCESSFFGVNYICFVNSVL